MDRLTDYMETVPKFFGKDMCEDLILLYESYNTQAEAVSFHKAPQFKQLNLIQLKKIIHPEEFHDAQLIDDVIQRFKNFEANILQSPMAQWFPQKFSWEEMRIKKYEPDTDDQYGPHVDVADANSSKRFLAFLVYLNEGFEGGQTFFHLMRNTEVCTPKTGGLLMFPPLWMYPHSGAPVKKAPKYILSTYLNYV